MVSFGQLREGVNLGTDVTGTKAVSGSRSVANEGIFILSANNTIGGTQPHLGELLRRLH